MQNLAEKLALRMILQNRLQKHTGEVSISWKVLGMQQQMKFVL